MKNIILLCNMGMSTSILVKKMQDYAQQIEFDCKVSAYPISDIAEVGKTADVVLLGPQVRFQLERVKTMVKCPVDVIDVRVYGMMDGESVIKQVNKLLI